MLLIGLIALLYASGCAAVALIPFYFSRRDSRFYHLIWGIYLTISVSTFGLFVAQWKYDSTNRQSGSNWGTSEGPITVLGNLSNDLFHLTVLFQIAVLVILFLVSGWGHPKRSGYAKHGANKAAMATRNSL